MRRIGSAARDAERKSVMTLQTMLSLNTRFSQSINEMPWIQPIQGVVDEIRRSNRKSPQLIGPALLLQDVIASGRSPSLQPRNASSASETTWG